MSEIKSLRVQYSFWKDKVGPVQQTQALISARFLFPILKELGSLNNKQKVASVCREASHEWTDFSEEM